MTAKTPKQTTEDELKKILADYKKELNALKSKQDALFVEDQLLDDLKK
ncbi:MAG: hypothetical protein WCG55_04120 [bacterium]